MEKITLHNNLQFPQLGFGVFQITDQRICEESVLAALRTGYRLLDTAACYDNERAVGTAIKRSGLKREEIFISSKVWIQDAGYEKTKASFFKTLANLQIDYLDLYLIHMPYGDYHASWRAMEELYHAGKIKAIGVCNFMPDRLIDLILSHDTPPMINQIELHPFCQQKRLREIMQAYQIIPMAWAPFAEGRENIFNHAALQHIGAAYNKSTAQVILRWEVQLGVVPIPKASSSQHQLSNLDIFDFRLTDEEVSALTDLDKADGRRPDRDPNQHQEF